MDNEELKMEKEILRRVEERYDKVRAKVSILEDSYIEVETLKEELRLEKEKREENQVQFTERIDKLIEELSQLWAKNAMLEHRMEELKKGNSSVRQEVPDGSGEQGQAGNSYSSTSSSTSITSPTIAIVADPEVIVLEVTGTEVIDAQETRVPEVIHRKATGRGHKFSMACICGMEFASDTCLSVHIGEKTVGMKNVAEPQLSTSSAPAALPLLTETTSESSSSLPTKNISRPNEHKAHESRSRRAPNRDTEKVKRENSKKEVVGKRKRAKKVEKACAYRCKICEIGYECPYKLQQHLQRVHDVKEIAPTDLLCNSFKASSDNDSLDGMPVLTPEIELTPSKGPEKQAEIKKVGSTAAPSKIAANRKNKKKGNHGKDPCKKMHCLCGAKFRKNVTLYDHVRYFTGINLLRCKTCGKQFVYASQAKRHSLHVHKEKFVLGCSNWRNFSGVRGGRKGKQTREKSPTEEAIQIKMEVFESAEDLETETVPLVSHGPEEPLYCLCNQTCGGCMIKCDNENCAKEWFHYECVGISSVPKGKWYCPQCRPNIPGPSSSFI